MITILGLGNVLMGDDGFGPAVVRAFENQYVTGPGVSVVDLGTPGLDMTPWFADVEHVILVDTVAGRMPPGTICLYDKRDLVRRAPTARVSPHEPGVTETLLTLELAGRAPRNVTLVGVVPESTDLRLTLSPAVQRAVLDAVQAVAEALARSGVKVACRRYPLTDQSPWHALASA